MLDFCAEHGLAAEIEVIPASEINAAYERVLSVRRAVPVRDRRGHLRLNFGIIRLNLV